MLDLGEDVETPVQRPRSVTAARAIWRTCLTPREVQVATLVGSGAGNAQIAQTLRISPRTVEKHLTAIFVKLGFRSRTELAIFIVTEATTR